ncbi:uncharacterized protein KGF55_005288 [Candida pseudojiufengensis]|uniref:uncharacterized protein n=1 Tax=Candida pseudojiufengensis TaxID=497109 RepID=UPI00222595FE|nr:uncharacterized protein KGF55_005288 [Candida pseudojiufengensis]KAI5959644.1 hypothetical protein KGF55_005288 [Candida pseudojiufengensis]
MSNKPTSEEIAPDTPSPFDLLSSYGLQLKHIDTAIALYDYKGNQSVQLTLNLGDTVYILAKSETGWWDGIVIGNNGELNRGWIPSNYIRSVNYVQPVLKKMKDNKELDTITAANTAANVLIPSFTNFLQKNLLESEKNTPSNSTRKNSVVSFASSETSLPSESRQINQQPSQIEEVDETSRNSSTGTDGYEPEYTHHPSLSLTLSGSEVEDVELVDVEKAEKLVEDYKTKNNKTVTWLPKYSSKGDFVFFCQQLNIYCESVPLSEFDPQFIPPNLEYADTDAIKNTSVLQLKAYPTTEMGLGQRETSSTTSFESLKRDSHSSVSSQSTQASYHHFSRPFFAMTNLFYKHSSDISSWTKLKEEILYILELFENALLNDNVEMFNTHFARLNKLVVLICASVRLDQADYIESKYEKQVTYRLKKICSSLSQIYVKGLLHLNRSNSGVINLNTKFEDEPNSISLRNSKETSKDIHFTQVKNDINILKNNAVEIINLFTKLTANKTISAKDYDSSGGSDDESQDRSDVLPQAYPRYLSDEFNGGNWCNPFFYSQNSFLNVSGNELKNRYHLKVLLDQQALDSVYHYVEEMAKVSQDALNILTTQSDSTDPLMEKNSLILRLIYKFLHHSSSLIDLMESFDFTVFCLVKKNDFKDENNMEKLRKSVATLTIGENNDANSNLSFDYPIVLNFFQFKQEFHNLVSNIIMATQSSTENNVSQVKDIIKNDPLYYDKEILKNSSERTALLLSNVLLKSENPSGVEPENNDSLLASYLNESIEACETVVDLTQKLIDERESILNYSTRVMHDDFDVQLLLLERNNTISAEKTEEHSYYSAGQNNSTDVPWYLQGDDEHDLLLDVKGNIKGGTKEALVSHLTHHDMFDSQFNAAFMLTIATMMSIGEFIMLLINRFDIEAPEGLSFEDYNNWIMRKQNPIRLRVMNIMKLLIEKNWSPSYYNESVLQRWLNFVESPAVQSFSIGRLLAADLKRLIVGEYKFVERLPIISNAKPPAPLTKGSSLSRKVKLLDIDYVELARQLTLREFKLYCHISKFACLAKVWGKKSGLNESIETITSFIKASNQLTNFVAFMILRKNEPKKRVQIIRYFIQVAEKCRQYNNFSSMTAIISALYSSPIHRLRKTWNFASPESLAHLKNMNKLMNSSRNFNEYRDVLKFIGSEPCVPFFGVYLSDLTFVFHGNPDFLINRTRMINFSKRAKTSEIVSGIDRFKNAGYNFQEVTEIQKYLDSWFDKCPSIEEQYKISLNKRIFPYVNNKSNNNMSLKLNRNNKSRYIKTGLISGAVILGTGYVILKTFPHLKTSIYNYVTGNETSTSEEEEIEEIENKSVIIESKHKNLKSGQIVNKFEPEKIFDSNELNSSEKWSIQEIKEWLVKNEVNPPLNATEDEVKLLFHSIKSKIQSK